MPKQNETKDADQPSQQRDWKKYLYTEEGFVLIVTIMSAVWAWYRELWGKGANYDSFFYRKLNFLEPVFGEHYVPILFSALAIVVALEVWRQGSK
jgi:hypothetical protein